MNDGVDSNRTRLAKMIALVEATLPPWVEARLAEHYGKNWRLHAQLPTGVGRGGGLDLQAWLRLFTNEWNEVFSKSLGNPARAAAVAVNAGRNEWAHKVVGRDSDKDVTLQALSGAAALLEAIKAPNAGQARALADAFITHRASLKAGTPTAPPAPEAARQTLTLQPQAVSAPPPAQLGLDLDEGRKVGSLEPWRLIAPPREDITSGRLTLDHFAADLAAVDRGQGGETYGDPAEFYRATHITGGLKLVLESGAARLATGKGPSVIGLQTSFGGGKTHAMLALLHLVRAADPGALAGVKNILGEGVKGLAGAKAVAFSGTDKGKDEPLDSASQKPIRTLWGYIAHRLAGEEGLALVAGAEAGWSNPGAEVLEKVLIAAGGPALVLLDEIVAYVRQFEGAPYESLLTFFQSLTEAAARTPQALIVGSLPESETEAGGAHGKETLHRLERIFARTQVTWQPAQGAETYAIVRRRLFQDLDEAGIRARDKSIEAYRKLYRDHKGDFPEGVSEAAYAELMREAYPVHPLLFDRLAQEWGSLEKFQRTRGVLKFVAEAARRIWLNGWNDPLIQPGHLPLADPAVRGSLLAALEGPAWGAIIDGEVESDRALPVLLDGEKQRFGQVRAATRAARATFLLTAPRGEAKGGMTGGDLRLACAWPGVQLSVFGDALNELAGRAGHLYSSGQAWWFGSQPTLRKLAQGRAQELTDDDADDAIVALLETERASKGGFARVHVCPQDPAEVEEGTAVALVILHPRTAHDVRGEHSAALAAADRAVRNRGGGQRLARNTLVFVAAETAALAEARKAAKLLLAWRSIRDDRSLDLKDSQREDAKRQADDAALALTTGVRRAWAQILAPEPRRAKDGEPFDLKRIPAKPSSGRTVPQVAWDKLIADGDVHQNLGPRMLADRLKEAWPADADGVSLATVRDWFTRFVAFERLAGESVLADAVRALLDDPGGAYAYADAVDADGRYRGVVLPAPGRLLTVRFDGDAALVKREVAEQHAPAPTPQPSGGDTPRAPGPGGVGEPPHSTPRVLRKFVGEVELDPVRSGRDFSKIIDEVVNNLLQTDGVKLRLRLDIEATAPGGFSPDDAAVVRDNARSLKFNPDGTRFEEG